MPEITLPETQNYKFFSHKTCECFPCHSAVDEASFNCLFCYCPLYALGRKCRGNFKYTKKGIKDCSGCSFPHRPESYDIIVERFNEVAELIREAPAEESESR